MYYSKNRQEFQMRKYIAEGIDQYLSENKKPWHMPGHKRKIFFNPEFARDFTEVPGLDDYHHAAGMILNSETELARVYHTYRSYYLVNGSTVGILSAIYACCKASGENGKKKAVIVARNCHTSVYHAIELLQIHPIYVNPDYLEEGRIYGSVRPERIRGAIEKNSMYDILCCIVTSPTYEGVLSDIGGIRSVLDLYKIPLVVDEAHGAHLPFTENFGKSAVSFGADFVIQSLHKTLPALTQTAVVHIPFPEGVDSETGCSEKQKAFLEEKAEKLHYYLSVFQTSSPSYRFLETMEACVAWCEENKTAFREYEKNVLDFRKEAAGLSNIHLWEPKDVYGCDPSRLVFLIEGMKGEEAKKWLEDNFGIVMEMAGIHFVTAITSVMDKKEDFSELLISLRGLDEELSRKKQKGALYDTEMDDGIFLDTEQGFVRLSEAEGLRIRNYIYAYPPGVPLIAPYEIITHETICEISMQLYAGRELKGITKVEE